jgi:hypothetical protein
MSMTTLPISVVSFLICGLARISLPQRGDSFLARLLKARECVRQAVPMLVAKLGARESSLDHCHEGLAVRSASSGSIRKSMTPCAPFATTYGETLEQPLMVAMEITKAASAGSS